VIVLDAGVLIGLLEPADAFHDRALTLVEGLATDLAVHTLTLAEVLVGPARVGLAERVRSDLLDIGVRVVDLGADEARTLARIRVEHRLKMPDACVLATAIHLGRPLATFDERLAVAARSYDLLHAS
jgi:predicted nucleic acid-binding protein